MKTVGLIVALIVLLGYCNVQNMNMVLASGDFSHIGSGDFNQI